MNTDLAKKWNEKQFPTDYCTAEKEAVLAFARYLDEREEAELKAMVQPVHRKPRKEDKPVCEGDVFTCPDGFNCTHAKPKPEPIEEWVDPFDYDWSNDTERDFRRIAGVLVGIGKRLNAVCKRLNTLTK